MCERCYQAWRRRRPKEDPAAELAAYFASTSYGHAAAIVVDCSTGSPFDPRSVWGAAATLPRRRAVAVEAP